MKFFGYQKLYNKIKMKNHYYNCVLEQTYVNRVAKLVDVTIK